MKNQIIRILLGMAILVGSINLSAAYFSKKETLTIKLLDYRNSQPIEKKELKRKDTKQKKKTYDISPLALLKNLSSTIVKIAN